MNDIYCEMCGLDFDREQCAGWNKYDKIFDCFNHFDTIVGLRAECVRLKELLDKERR